MATTMLRVELEEARGNMTATLRALPTTADREKETVPVPEKFDGTRSKLRNFITQLRLRAAIY